MKTSTKLVALLSASLLLGSTAIGQRAPYRGRTPVNYAKNTNKTALLILLENGGVAANFAECKVGTQRVRLPKIPVARCGRLGLALQPGENAAQMVRRAATVIRRHRGCTDPRRWRVQLMTFDQWFKLSSDLLLEELAKSIVALQNAKTRYGRVIVLEDKALNPRNTLARMTQLASAGYTLDVHVLTHGGKDVIVGGEVGGKKAYFTPKTFFGPAGRIRGLKIRSVYQMNCVSGTLIEEWQKLGAKVVNGTYGEKNNYMPQSYFHFTAKWLNGETFGGAVLGAYQEARAYTEPVYKLIGWSRRVHDSRHRIAGDGRCRLFTPRSNNPGRRVVAQTTAALCAGYRKARKTAEQACLLLVRAGCKIHEVARELTTQYSCRPSAIARYLRRAKCTADQIASCLQSTLRCSAQTAAKHLIAAGCSATDTARALVKRYRCSVKLVAKYLRAAGCGTNTIARLLRRTYKCSTKTATAYLKYAGCSFNQTARAIWACSAKNARALQSLIDSMVAAFRMNVAQVGAAIARLGIRC